MTTTVGDVIGWIEAFAPVELAEDWDNVGLLLGGREFAVHSLMTCLTLTPDVAHEALTQGAGLIITHHPILFRAVKRLTRETAEGRMLWDLIRAGVAVYSPHTAYDNGEGGINEQLAERLGLLQLAPLRPRGVASVANLPGAGRFGDLPATLSWEEFQGRVTSQFGVDHFQSVPPDRPEIRRVGIACGSAGEYLPDAERQGCDVFLTGEARFHTALEARALNVGLILLGHYATERPALEILAARLSDSFPSLQVWASRQESDPLIWD